jgi:hypothetical protein
LLLALRAVHSRMVPRSPCSVAANLPRLRPGVRLRCGPPLSIEAVV